MLFKLLLECSHRQVGHHLPLLLWPMGKTWPLLLLVDHCCLWTWPLRLECGCAVPCLPACVFSLSSISRAATQGFRVPVFVHSCCICLYVRALYHTCTPPNSNYLACFETALVFAPQWFLYTSVAHIDARHEWRHQRTSTLIYVGGCRSRAMTGFDACCLGWRRRQDGDGTDDKQETPTDLPHHPSSC